MHHQASQWEPRNNHVEPHLQRVTDWVVPGWQCPEQNEGAAAEIKLSAHNAPSALDSIQLGIFMKVQFHAYCWNKRLIKCNHSFLFVTALPLRWHYEKGVQLGLLLSFKFPTPFFYFGSISVVPQLFIFGNNQLKWVCLSVGWFFFARSLYWWLKT